MQDYDYIPEDDPEPAAPRRRTGPASASVWNLLAAFFLGLTGLTCLCMLTIFINPYVALNPFPPPEGEPLPLFFQPNAGDPGEEATATLPPLPPVWTATPGVGGPTFADTPTVQPPLATGTATGPAEPSATPDPGATPTPTPIPPGDTAAPTGYPGGTATPVTPVPTSGTPYP